MTKKYFSVFLVLFAAPSALAQIQALNADAVKNELKEAEFISSSTVETRFSDLVQRFETAATPTRNEIKGWWSGRCFYPKTPDAAENALLVGTSELIGGSQGPLYPPREAYKIIHLVWTGKSADVYDEPSREIIDSVAGLLSNGGLTGVSEAVETQGSLASSNTPGNLEWRIRKNGPYFFEESIILRTNNDYKAGEIFAACYYFKKIHE